MSERKVLNKYYPPDFDPSKIPRLRLPKERQYTVRLMAPCNMKCTTCGEYIYKGKKFNARKETVQNEEYLGIKIFRFYIKCPRCLAEVTFKTDPENADYIVEHGATRNFQALKLAEEAAEKEVKEKEEEEKNNPMTLLENRTKASKNEMESLEALEEIRELNQRHVKVDFEQLLHQNHLKLIEKQKKQEEEDEAFIKSVFYTADGESVKRIIDEPISEAKISDKASNGSFPNTFTTSIKSGSLKRKLPDQGSSSRQRSIDALKKAVVVKKSSPATVPNTVSATATVPNTVSATATAPNTASTTATGPNTVSATATGPNTVSATGADGNKQPSLNSSATGLNLLSAYSDSDSED